MKPAARQKIAMPYSQFKTLESVVSTFDLNVEDRAHLYSRTAPISPSDRLCEVINEGLDLAIATSTAKARSEFNQPDLDGSPPKPQFMEL